MTEMLKRTREKMQSDRGTLLHLRYQILIIGTFFPIAEAFGRPYSDPGTLIF